MQSRDIGGHASRRLIFSADNAGWTARSILSTCDCEEFVFDGYSAHIQRTPIGNLISDCSNASRLSSLFGAESLCILVSLCRPSWHAQLCYTVPLTIRSDRSAYSIGKLGGMTLIIHYCCATEKALATRPLPQSSRQILMNRIPSFVLRLMAIQPGQACGGLSSNAGARHTDTIMVSGYNSPRES